MTRILGVLNVTPDSFSDGGRWEHPDAAIAHGLLLRSEGADWIDVGGESTRPGAERVDPVEERRRVIPVVRALVAGGAPVSIDTRNASTAAAALEAGATIVNDVTGGLFDADMVRVAADSDALFVAMHWRGEAGDPPTHVDPVAEVRAELGARVEQLVASGIPLERLIVDPGLGFAKTASDNWALLRELELFSELAPVLVAASRKRFIARLLPEGAPVEQRDAPTAVVSALAARSGAWGVRVHDVAATRLALDVQRRWRGGDDDRA